MLNCRQSHTGHRPIISYEYLQVVSQQTDDYKRRYISCDFMVILSVLIVPHCLDNRGAFTEKNYDWQLVISPVPLLLSCFTQTDWTFCIFVLSPLPVLYGLANTLLELRKLTWFDCFSYFRSRHASTNFKDELHSRNWIASNFWLHSSELNLVKTAKHVITHSLYRFFKPMFLYICDGLLFFFFCSNPRAVLCGK